MPGLTLADEIVVLMLDDTIRMAEEVLHEAQRVRVVIDDQYLGQLWLAATSVAVILMLKRRDYFCAADNSSSTPLIRSGQTVVASA